MKQENLFAHPTPAHVQSRWLKMTTPIPGSEEYMVERKLRNNGGMEETTVNGEILNCLQGNPVTGHTRTCYVLGTKCGRMEQWWMESHRNNTETRFSSS